MGIEIPGSLEWVAYLTGSEWPQGDETAMFRIGDYWRASAGELNNLIPELNRVRSETTSVLMGETADAAEAQFRMLFDGDYAVDKLADAMSALGGLSDSTGTEIEYTKLQILTSLAIAAAEIIYALASSPPTYGASLAWIPVTEAITIAAVRQLVAQLLRGIVRELGQALTKTAVKRLIKEMGKELAIGVGQELAIQAFQIAEGNRKDVDWKQVGITAASSAVAVAAAAPISSGINRGLGPAQSRLGGMGKGAVAGYTGEVVGNVAGALATGQQLDAVSIFGGAATGATSSGIHGARGDHAANPTNSATNHGGAPASSPTTPTVNPGAGAGAGAGANTGSGGNPGNAQSGSTSSTGGGGNEGGGARSGGNGAKPDHSAGAQPAAREPGGAPVEQTGGGPESPPRGSESTTQQPVSPGSENSGGDIGHRPGDGVSREPGESGGPQSDRSATPDPVNQTGAREPATPGQSAQPTAQPTAGAPAGPAVAPGATSTPTAPMSAPQQPGQTSSPSSDRGQRQATLSEQPAARASTQQTGLPAVQTAQHTAAASNTDAAGTAGAIDAADAVRGTDPGSEAPGATAGLAEPTGGAQVGQPNGTDATRNPADSARNPTDPALNPAEPTHNPAEPTHNPADPTHNPTDSADIAWRPGELGELRTVQNDGDTRAVHEQAQRVRDLWNGLDESQRRAFIDAETQPSHHTTLGDLDGLPSHVRDQLNRHNLLDDMMARYPADADRIQNFVRELDAHLNDPLTNERPAVLVITEPGRLAQLGALLTGRSDDVRLACNARAAWDAVYGHEHTGHPRQLYTYDPMAFGGDGRIAVAVGNLDTAQSVGVYTPGITTTIGSIEATVNAAENVFGLSKDRRADLNTAVVAWIGYDAPSGLRIAQQTATQALAREGGNRLAHDVAGLVGSRATAPSVHLFGHSYGSTTTAHAGVDGRLHELVTTVTLLGSPGAGPLTHAKDFGIGADNVYVASSSRDLVTWAGSTEAGGRNRSQALFARFAESVATGVYGNGPPLLGLEHALMTRFMVSGLPDRLAGLGQGLDPAMESFGAVRLAAEYVSPQHHSGINPHTNYFATEVIGPDGKPELLRNNPSAAVTESLRNLSHILTGDTDRLHTVDPRQEPSTTPRTDAERHRDIESVLTQNDCAFRAIEGYLAEHPDSSVRELTVDADGRGVTAAEYEAALGTQLRDATVPDILAATANGQTVFVVDSYHAEGLPGDHPGAHTYRVEPNPADPHRPLLYEGTEPRPWPPRALDQVNRTQIATFHPDGTPTHPMRMDGDTSTGPDDVRIGDEQSVDDHGERHHELTDYPPEHISQLLDLPGYRPGSLSATEARSVYLNGEQQMRMLHDALIAQGVDTETRARAMFEARNELRSWARELMADREIAQRITRENPNHSWGQVVAKYSDSGVTPQQVFERIVERSTQSRAEVNRRLGLDPDKPPPLPRTTQYEPRIAPAPPDRTSAAQHDEELLIAFSEGSTENLIGKSEEYARQLDRQIDALNEMTASELLDNMANGDRDGRPQQQARAEYRKMFLKQAEIAARRLVQTAPAAFGGLSVKKFAEKQADEAMSLLAALHEPDIVAGGNDVMRRDENGVPVMGDRYVNSSIGAQWRTRVADLRAYAERMVAAGYGDHRLNVTWSLLPRS